MDNNSLYHHGIKGQRWGVRRYQNKNGSLTPAGRKRYANKEQEKPKELTPEEKKAQVLKSRSAKTLYENRQMFNYDEMSKAYNLLTVDENVRKMIVEEPNKVKKFLKEAGDYASKIKDVVSPVVDTAKKLQEFSNLFGGDGSASSSGNTSNSRNTNNGNRNRNSNENRNSNTNESDSRNPDSGDPTPGPSRGSGGTSRRGTNESGSLNPDYVAPTTRSSLRSGGTSSRKSDIYDVDWTDITPSGSLAASTLISAVGSATKVAEIASSSVKSLPAASSETKAFISDNVAGYLPGPKEDD